MRLLVINPNTSTSMTDLVVQVMQGALPPGVEFTPATARFGARYIGSRAASAIASHAAIELLSENVEGHDAVILACFGDPALSAMKELSPVPVIGLAEASCHLATTLGQRFSIVTGGARWKTILEEFVAGIGLESRLAGVRTIRPTGADVAKAPEKALDELAAACRACIEEDGAEVVILGGAGLAGLAERIADAVPVPVLCSVAAGAVMAHAVASLAVRKAKAGSLALPDPISSIGLAPALGQRLGEEW